MLFEQLAHRGQVRGLPGHRPGQGGIERGRAIEIEQMREARGDGA